MHHDISSWLLRGARLAVAATLTLLTLSSCKADEEETQGPRPRLVVSVSPTWMDGSSSATTEVLVTAVDATARMGTGTVLLRARAGVFANGAAEETLTLQDGSARTTFRCVVAENPLCAGPLPIRAEWNDVRGSATVELPGAESTGGVPVPGTGGNGGSSAQLVLVGPVADTAVDGWAPLSEPGVVTGMLVGTMLGWVATQSGAPLYVRDDGLFVAVSDPWDSPLQSANQNDTRRTLSPGCGTGGALIPAVPTEADFAHGCHFLSTQSETWYLGAASVTFDHNFALLAGSGTTGLLWRFGGYYLIQPGGIPMPVEWPAGVIAETNLHWAMSGGFRTVVLTTSPEGSRPTAATIKTNGAVTLGESYPPLDASDSMAWSLDGSGNIFSIQRSDEAPGGFIIVRHSPGAAEATTVYRAPECRTDLTVPRACLHPSNMRLLQKR